MQFTRVGLGLLLALIVTATCVAQDADKKQDAKAKKATERAVKNTTDQLMKAFAKANLTDEQKQKATALIEKHIGSLMEARAAQNALLTDEQKKNRTEAVAKAKEEGTKGNKLAIIGTKALGLSREKMKEFNAAKKKVTAVTAKMKEEITDLLTDEQKAALPKRANNKGDQPKAKKGKKNKERADKTQTVSLKLPGMICGGCAASVRSSLNSVEGIADIKTNVENNTCSFTAPGELNVKAMLDKLAAGGNKQIEGWSVSKGPAL